MLTIKSIIYDDRIKNWKTGEHQKFPHHIFLFIADGKASYTVEGETIELKRGDTLLIRSGTARQASDVCGVPHQKYSAHFTADSDLEQQLFAGKSSYMHGQVQRIDYFKQRFSTLLLQWFNRHEADRLVCAGILLELLGLAITRPAELPSISPKKLNLIRLLQNYILHHYSEPIRLTDLADYCQRSPNHITKLFREVLKQTPTQYIHQVKVEMACELLKESRMSIAEISDYLGFCEPSYFYRIFKKFTGSVPSAVQKGLPGQQAPLPASAGTAARQIGMANNPGQKQL